MDWETHFDSDLWDTGAKRASAQLGTILNGMKLRVVEKKPQLAFRKDEQMIYIGKGEMNTIEEKALNPCYILVEAIPKRQVVPKGKYLQGFLDQLILNIGGYPLY